jgi:hypothetical protein
MLLDHPQLRRREGTVNESLQHDVGKTPCPSALPAPDLEILD